MGRPIDPAYIKRNKKIVDDYVVAEKSIHSISAETGLKQLRIRRILEAAGVELRPEKRQKHTEIRARNNYLVIMGARLQAERARRSMSMVELAVELGITEQNLSAAVQGLYDWKFYEMVRAAKFLNLDLENFIHLPEGMKTCRTPTTKAA